MCDTPWGVPDHGWLADDFRTKSLEGNADVIERVRTFWKERVHEWIDDVSTKRCCCCLEHKPRSAYSNGQWNAKDVRPKARRKIEQRELSEPLAACIATFDQAGESLSWRKCIQCMAQTKCLRGPLGMDTKNSLQPDWSFLDWSK